MNNILKKAQGFDDAKLDGEINRTKPRGPSRFTRYQNVIEFKPESPGDKKEHSDFIQAYRAKMKELLSFYFGQIHSNIGKNALGDAVKIQLANAAFDAPMQSIEQAGKLMLKSLDDIFKKAFNESQSVSLDNVREQGLGSASQKGWTAKEWGHTLSFLMARAEHQFGEAEKIFYRNENAENKRKMQIKKQYMVYVKTLIMKLTQIRNSRKIIDVNATIPDTWLTGGGAGGPGGRGPGGSGGGRGGRGGGRRYPGGGAPGEEGFSRESQALYNAPFGQKGRSNYLFVHKLLRAYGLDGDSKYQILMDTMPGELPSRPWWIRDVVAAMESIGGSRALFEKYVPALNDALSTIVKLYTDESGERYNPKQAELGTKYVASTRWMMEKMKMPELSSQQTIPERENVGGAGAPAKRAPTSKESFIAEWQGGKQHDEGYLERWGDYLDRRDFEEVDNGWLKKVNGRNKIFVKKDTGEIYRQVGKGWEPVGHILNKQLSQ